MKLITILVGNVFAFPPVMSLLHAVENMEIDSVFVTTKASRSLENEFPNTIIEEIDVDYESINSPIRKLSMIGSLRRKLWNHIDEHYDESAIIWSITDVTIKYLGNELLTRRYILHLLELSQELVYYHKLPIIKMNKEMIGNNAKAVVVPEYNRAHLTKTWWKLKKTPYILPNKPYNKVKWSKNENIKDETASKVISEIGNKKIILYQGVMSPERPLDMFIDAVDEYDGKYAFVVMSGGKNIYSDSKSQNYYFIPFVTPPDHLQITSHAHIGVLSYVPSGETGYSPLNSLYCAPNKTFEFAMFGIPMLGNDNPGLKFLFDTNHCGRCFSEYSKESICNAINEIEKEYAELSANASTYYSGCDYEKILRGIFKEVLTAND